MKNRMKLTLIAFSLLSAQIQAQEKTLGLNEAIDLSIQNSKQLKNSQAKIDEATAALKEAVEKRLPDAKASASYLRFNSPNVDLKMKPASGSGGGSTSAEVPKMNQAGYGLINLSLPIYTG